MLLLQPQKRIRMVCWATAFGVLGSILGYGIGYYFIQWAMPHMDQWGYLDVFLKVKSWFATWGLWLLLPASVLPFPPFKILTITAGASGVHFLSFLGVTFIVRWVHFFLLPLLPVLGQWVWKEYRREEGPSMSI
jgi:membrane protein YqaA with SNARE-associated domain